MAKKKSKRKDGQRAKNKGKSERRQHREDKKMLSNADLKNVLLWKERIESNIQAAIACYTRMNDNGLLDDEDLLAALARYVENTAEAITKLDDLTHGDLFAELFEVPIDSDASGALTWQNLKGIRIRLAHKFWETDASVLLSAVRDDFPGLETLFRLLLINQEILVGDEVSFTLKGADFLFPDSATPPAFGDYAIVMLYFRGDGWHPWRVSAGELTLQVSNERRSGNPLRFVDLRKIDEKGATSVIRGNG